MIWCFYVFSSLLFYVADYPCSFSYACFNGIYGQSSCTVCSFSVQKYNSQHALGDVATEGLVAGRRLYQDLLGLDAELLKYRDNVERGLPMMALGMQTASVREGVQCRRGQCCPAHWLQQDRVKYLKVKCVMDMYLLWVRRNVSNKSAMCEHSLRFTPLCGQRCLGYRSQIHSFSPKKRIS